MRSLLLAMLLSLAASSASTALSPGDGWTRLTIGDDYVIYSHAPDRTTRDIASRLQAFRGALSLVTHLKIDAPEPVTIIVFRDYPEFMPYVQTLLGHKQDLGALTLTDQDGDAVLVNGDDWLRSVGPPVYAGLVYTFTHRGNASLPLWFTTGVAEFYSTFDVVRDQVKIGIPPEGHTKWLRARGLKPLMNVLTADRRSPEYQGGSRSNDFYTESWLLVHYLLLGNPERGKAAGQFLTLLAAHQPPDRACQLAFGVTVDALEQELLRYLGQGTFSFLRYTLSSTQHPIDLPSPVGRGELLYAIGNVLAHSNESRLQGKAMLEESAELKERRAETLADLALLEEASGVQGKGDPLFEKAVALGSGSAVVYRQYGRSLLARQKESPDAAQVAKARSMFAKSVELNPRVAEAHVGLGMTYLLMGGDMRVGIKELEKGLELDPENTNAAMNLVALLVHEGETRHAEEVIAKNIAPFADADTLRRARDLLEKK